MSDVTRILHAIEHGDAKAADELLPLVYEQRRKLAAVRMANESAGPVPYSCEATHSVPRRAANLCNGMNKTLVINPTLQSGFFGW
jgi:hypothetical protein